MFARTLAGCHHTCHKWGTSPVLHGTYGPRLPIWVYVVVLRVCVWCMSVCVMCVMCVCVWCVCCVYVWCVWCVCCVYVWCVWCVCTCECLVLVWGMCVMQVCACGWCCECMWVGVVSVCECCSECVWVCGCEGEGKRMVGSCDMTFECFWDTLLRSVYPIFTITTCQWSTFTNPHDDLHHTMIHLYPLNHMTLPLKSHDPSP